MVQAIGAARQVAGEAALPRIRMLFGQRKANPPQPDDVEIEESYDQIDFTDNDTGGGRW